MKHGLPSTAVLAVYRIEPPPRESYGICYKNRVFGSFGWRSHLSLTYLRFLPLNRTLCDFLSLTLCERFVPPQKT